MRKNQPLNIIIFFCLLCSWATSCSAPHLIDQDMDSAVSNATAAFTSSPTTNGDIGHSAERSKPLIKVTATMQVSKSPTLTLKKTTATVSPTATAFIPQPCQMGKGAIWSNVFSTETSYIHTLLPLPDGDVLMAGTLDSNEGMWVAKFNLDGVVIWQKIFSPPGGILSIAPNGNAILRYPGRSMELDHEGNVIKSLQVEAMVSNADGSTTVVKAGQIMRFSDPSAPSWSFQLASPMVGSLTTDGGALYAYGAAYIDKSVYYMPFYTDIKVIKIDGNGIIRQRVYGKLVGDERLDYAESTADGGALLAGSHSYEELGSDYDIWLMKINSSGGISWQTTLKKAPTSESIRSIFHLSNGFLITSEDYDNNVMRLVKLNKNGTLAWQKRIHSIRGPFDVFVADDLPDGSLIIAGQTLEKNYVSLLAKINPRGQIVWEKLIGFNLLPGSPDSFVDAIVSFTDGSILIGGGSNMLGDTITSGYGAWLARIADEGVVSGFLTLSPLDFTIYNTLSSRPNTLPDEVFEPGLMVIDSAKYVMQPADYPSFPACSPAGVTYPTPESLPSLTPSVTPTLSFVRDLYLQLPDHMKGDDVLNLQLRLLELGYTDVGKPDGIFGKMTDQAVRLFQERNGLEVDGYVGPITWKKLFSEAAIPKS